MPVKKIIPEQAHGKRRIEYNYRLIFLSESKTKN
jgi:hypothetical protein